MVLSQIRQFQVSIADFLGKGLIESPFISIDLWSIVHIFAGLLVALFILEFGNAKTKERNAVFFIGLFVFLFIYEIFEFVFYRRSDAIFRPESTANVISDLVFGMIGGFIATRVKK